jgi:hypothetical protein
LLKNRNNLKDQSQRQHLKQLLALNETISPNINASRVKESTFALRVIVIRLLYVPDA